LGLGLLFLSSCETAEITVHALVTSKPDEWNLPVGFAAGDEPRAVKIGRDVLAEGGNAADAAVAVAFALAVTLPSRAGLDGGGICLLHQGKEVRSLDFLPATGQPAAYKLGLARGLQALHGAYGTMRWERVVAPAEALARLGVPASKVLAADIARFGPMQGELPADGSLKRNDALAGSLADLRQRGTGNIPTGTKAVAPVWRDEVAQDFASQHGYSLTLTGKTATGFVTVDKNGGAASCLLTRGGLFGADVAGQGGSAMLVAEGETLSAALVGTDESGALREVAARVLTDHVPLDRALAAPRGAGNSSGGIDAVICPSGVPAEVPNCQTRADPRGFGLAGVALGR